MKKYLMVLLTVAGFAAAVLTTNVAFSLRYLMRSSNYKKEKK